MRGGAASRNDNRPFVELQRISEFANRLLWLLANSILVMAYHMIQRKQPYQELGGNYLDQRDAQKVTNRLVGRLEKLAYTVSLQQISTQPIPDLFSYQHL